MSIWPGDPLDPSFLFESICYEAWRRAVDPDAAARAPSPELRLLPEMEERARQWAGGPVERYIAICEFDAQAFYVGLAPHEREELRSLAAKRGQFRLLAWLAEQDAMLLQSPRATSGPEACNLH